MINLLKRRTVIAVAFVSTLTATTQVSAQSDYPNKPISWIVAYPAGGGSDFLARTVANRLSKQLGQSIVIENRPGAATIVGAQAASRAAPDGYTIFTADNGSLVFNPALYSNLPYKTSDFAAVGLMARFPLILVSNTSTGYATAKAVIDDAKANPQKISYASPGAGGPHHLAMELLKNQAGIEAQHIAYKGAAPAVQDLVSGQIPVMMLDTATAFAHLKGGKIKPLAVASAARLPQLPDVPTFKELGYAGVEVYAWQGLVVPAATPAAIRQKLSEELVKTMADPETKKLLTDFGLEVVSSDSKQMTTYIESETKIWHRLIRDSGIKLEN